MLELFPHMESLVLLTCPFVYFVLMWISSTFIGFIVLLFEVFVPLIKLFMNFINSESAHYFFFNLQVHVLSFTWLQSKLDVHN